MFIWQKLGYKLVFVKNDEDIHFIETAINTIKPKIVAFDTETTGLNIIKDLPFLVATAFGKYIYVFEPSKLKNEAFLRLVSKKNGVDYLLAHNAKFDYHMFKNFGTPIPEDVNIGDTLALARLTDYVDSERGISLEDLGNDLVSTDAKIGGKVIREHIKLINKERRKLIKEYVKQNMKITYTSFTELMAKRVQFVETEYDKAFEDVDKIAPKANYLDSYLENPNLMINYIADDVVLVLEVFNKLIKILDVVDKDRTVWHRENQLVRTIGDMEYVGMRVDIKYILESRKRVIDYIESTYKLLSELSGVKFTSGQHEVIKKLFAQKYKIGMLASDEGALLEIIKYYGEEPAKIAKLILELRTLDKWLSTYIDGMLNRIVDGRVHTDINNSGANTGRVSSNLHQQPSEPLVDRDGNELFHPRKVFINDDGFKNFYVDFGNMELRVQAEYTILTSEGDENMCRAFMPFHCFNSITGEMFTPRRDKKEWGSGIWVNEDGTPWSALDLHSETTKKAFPHIDPKSPEFKNHYRAMGKRANFLKNYGGGKGALMVKIGVDEATAEALNRGYYEAFPKVLGYQRWVDNKIKTYGNVRNLMGRSYYFQNPSLSYRGYNYLIQGSCADYLKYKEIEIGNFLKDYKSKMVIPIHDEIVFTIADDEEFLIPRIKEIMEDAEIFMKNVPMVVEVKYTNTNWAEKVDWNES